MESLCCFLGFLLLAAGSPLTTATRFRDVLSSDKSRGYLSKRSPLHGWSSDENSWNEKLYPVWKRGDTRWRNSWKGGHLQAVLTSDSPALVGSTMTFVVNLVFPRCQKEDANGDIVYEKNCRNDTGSSTDQYVYNWTAWSEDSDTGNSSGQSHHNVFPDGKPFPHPHGRKRGNFIYVFHTLGQYFQKLGRCSVKLSLNTTNVTLGPQLMAVTVYRRHGRAFFPVAQVKDMYVVTDQIPVLVTMSQKNDRNASDHTFLKDVPITFDVFLHDPSHFLNESSVSYKWSFGDNTGLVLSSNQSLNHTYMLNGTFSLNLTVEATAPGPCPSFVPSPPPTSPVPSPSPGPATANSLELSENPVENCQINRYGYFRATLTIVEGILEVNIVRIEEVPAPQPGSSLVDLVVSCQGTFPTEVCTIISDPTCQSAGSSWCDTVDISEDEGCLLTVRRNFSGSGRYCVNLTLGDDASLALASTLVSVSRRDSAWPLQALNGILITAGCLVLCLAAFSMHLYRKHREYKPIGSNAGGTEEGKGLSAFLGHAKAVSLPGNQEKDALLRNLPEAL